jgi:hypothetical protein
VRVTLDNCRVCGGRITDFEPDGYERENGQRGHFSCDKAEKVRLSRRLQRLVTLRQHLYRLAGPGNAERMLARYDVVTNEVAVVKDELAPRWWPKDERLNRLLDRLDDAHYGTSRHIPTDWARIDLIDSRFIAAEDVLHALWDEQER